MNVRIYPLGRMNMNLFYTHQELNNLYLNVTNDTEIFHFPIIWIYVIQIYLHTQRCLLNYVLCAIVCKIALI